MKLFDEQIDKNRNLLPHNGEVYHYGLLLSPEKANNYFRVLLNTLDWKNDEAVIYGKHIITRRKVAWYADENYTYTYSNTTKEARKWTKELLELKKLVEAECGEAFNSCLLNLYHHGEEGMSWHSDDEKALGKNTTIASLSLGAERRFLFRHKKSNETVSLLLENGSLLVMKGETQTHWQHSLPKSKKIKAARINLTFRKMVV
jgi:alkylated DNA repair dioxygenase AlkB